MQRDNAHQTGLSFFYPRLFQEPRMCIRAIEENPGQLHDVPNHFKTQVMCDNVVCRDSYSLKYVPDGFVTQKVVKYEMTMITMLLILLSSKTTTKNGTLRGQK